VRIRAGHGRHPFREGLPRTRGGVHKKSAAPGTRGGQGASPKADRPASGVIAMAYGWPDCRHRWDAGTLADLPWATLPVRLSFQVRRFFLLTPPLVLGRPSRNGCRPWPARMRTPPPGRARPRVTLAWCEVGRRVPASSRGRGCRAAADRATPDPCRFSPLRHQPPRDLASTTAAPRNGDRRSARKSQKC